MPDITTAKVLDLFNLFVDGRGYAGKIDEFEPPKLMVKTEEFYPGGYAAPVEVDLGLEKMEATFTLLDWDREVLNYFGIGHNKPVSCTVRAGIGHGDGSATPYVYQLQGMWKEMEQPKLKRGEKLSLKVQIALKYYKLEVGGEVVHEIDPENGIRIANGTDYLAEARSAAGI